VAIARALAMAPGAADVRRTDERARSQAERRAAFTAARICDARTTMVVVSHSISFLEGLADRLLYMEGGEVVEYGETETILKSPQDPRTKDFLQEAK